MNIIISPIASMIIFMTPNLRYSLKKFFLILSLNVIFLFMVKFIVELIVPPMITEKM